RGCGCHERNILLLQPVLALGEFRRTQAAGDRAPASRDAGAQAFRLPGNRAAHGGDSAAHAPGAAPDVSRARARSLAQIPRHAAQSRAEALSEGWPARWLEQAARLDGD